MFVLMIQDSDLIVLTSLLVRLSHSVFSYTDTDLDVRFLVFTPRLTVIWLYYVNGGIRRKCQVLSDPEMSGHCEVLSDTVISGHCHVLTDPVMSSQC